MDIESSVKVIRAGNQSGKTITGARETVYKFLETHPYWKRSPEWGNEPLNLFVCSIGHPQITEIWEKKMKPFIDDSLINVTREKQYIRRVVHKESGNSITFFPHKYDAQDKAQGFVCHDFWIDEMPKDKRFIDEALVRIQARDAQLRLTFTPTVINEDIRVWCDEMPEVLGKVHKLNILDNPIYAGREEELIAKFNSMPKEEARMRLYGDWLRLSGTVFEWDKQKYYVPLPNHYSKNWDHVFGIDPAFSGYTGYCLFARDPDSHEWWMVKSGYLKEQVPSILAEKAENLIKGYNVKRRVVDPNATGFKGAVTHLYGIHYTGPYNKTGRKVELIRNLQERVGAGKLYIARGHNGDAVNELNKAVWNETSEGRIKHSTRFHILDAMQYVNDLLPPVPKKKTQRQMGYYERIIDEHEKEINKDTRQRQGRIKVKRNNRRWKK